MLITGCGRTVPSVHSGTAALDWAGAAGRHRGEATQAFARPGLPKGSGAPSSSHLLRPQPGGPGAVAQAQPTILAAPPHVHLCGCVGARKFLWQWISSERGDGRIPPCCCSSRASQPAPCPACHDVCHPSTRRLSPPSVLMAMLCQPPAATSAMVTPSSPSTRSGSVA